MKAWAERAAAVGAWALVHGLAHLITGRQISPDLLADVKIDGLIEESLADLPAGPCGNCNRRL